LVSPEAGPVVDAMLAQLWCPDSSILWGMLMLLEVLVPAVAVPGGVVATSGLHEVLPTVPGWAALADRVLGYVRAVLRFCVQPSQQFSARGEWRGAGIELGICCVFPVRSPSTCRSPPYALLITLVAASSHSRPTFPSHFPYSLHTPGRRSHAPMDPHAPRHPSPLPSAPFPPCTLRPPAERGGEGRQIPIGLFSSTTLARRAIAHDRALLDALVLQPLRAVAAAPPSTDGPVSADLLAALVLVGGTDEVRVPDTVHGEVGVGNAVPAEVEGRADSSLMHPSSPFSHRHAYCTHTL
jgi:hypothetical protein